MQYAFSNENQNSSLAEVQLNNLNSPAVTLNSSAVIDITLEYLNDQETKRRIVPLVYLSVLTILGVPGNILILFIYMVKFKKKATHRTFVVALAITDLLNCVFTIPFEIAQMTHEYTFYTEWLCKCGRTLNAIFTTSSALILVALSANRYRRICQPLGIQLTYHQALNCIVCISFLTLVLSWPESILTGLKLHDLENNLTGFDCSNHQHFGDTYYPMVHSIMMLFVYMSCMISLLIMCFSIGRNIIIQDEFRSQFRLSVMFRPKIPCKTIHRQNENKRQLHKYTKSATSPSIKCVTSPPTKSATSPSTKSKTKSPTKVTRTVLFVSLGFVIVFLPFVVIKLMAAIMAGNIMPPSQLASILLPTLSRTHFMNNVINFTIYICMDAAFRRHCKVIVVSIHSIVFNFINKH